MPSVSKRLKAARARARNAAKQRVLRNQKNYEIKTETVDHIDLDNDNVIKFDVKEEPEVPEEVDNWHYNDDLGEGEKYDVATEQFENFTEYNNNSESDDSAGADFMESESPILTAYSSPYNASTTVTVATGHEKHCLLCYQECDPLDYATENKDNVFRVMFLMKKMLQVPNHILEDYLLNFGSPNSWISLCSMCKPKVDKALDTQQQISQLERILRTCQSKMVRAIKISVAQLPAISSPSNRRVRNVTDETRTFVSTGEIDSCSKTESGNTKPKKMRKSLDSKNAATITSAVSFGSNDKKKKSRKPKKPLKASRIPAVSPDAHPLSIPEKVNDDSDTDAFSRLPSSSKCSSRTLEKLRTRLLKTAGKIKATKKKVKADHDSAGPTLQHKGSGAPPQFSRPILDDPVISSETIYTCSLCPQLEKMCFHSFVIHILFHHRRPYRCSVCNLYYSSHKELDHSALNEKRLKEDASGHVCTQDTLVKPNFPPEKIWSCEHCTELFDLESQRDHHEQEVHSSESGNSSELKHGCKTCGRKFRNLKDWSLHRAIEHPEVALLSCYFCHKNFGCKTKEGIDVNIASAITVNFHVRKEHINNRPYITMVTCDFCGQNFRHSTDLQEHVNKVHGLNPIRALSCCICFAKVQHPNILRAHLKDIHKAGTQESYVCDLCGYSVGRRVNFEVHNLEKHGIRPERGGVRTCEIEGCTFEYLRKHYLDRHMVTVHNAVRKHTCQYCGKGFIISNHRREHEKIHVNKVEKPFKCKICGNSFALRNYLYIHMRLSHLNRPFASTNKKRPSRRMLSQVPSNASVGGSQTESSTSSDFKPGQSSIIKQDSHQRTDCDQHQYGELSLAKLSSSD